MSRQQGNDFSKIQARFKTRMKLTSANVAEVIQKRLLKKNDAGESTCSTAIYEQKNNFGTLFDFADGSISLPQLPRSRSILSTAIPLSPTSSRCSSRPSEPVAAQRL